MRSACSSQRGTLRAISAQKPPGGVLVFGDSLYKVFELPGNSYFRVVDTVGAIAADRADLGTATLSYLQSPLPGEGRYLTVAYGGGRAAAATAFWPASPRGAAGAVLTERTDLTDGSASAVLRLHRRAVVVLSASFDPGWTVTVDGRPARTIMVAPALVAVTVSAGTHRVAFLYRGFQDYPQLFATAVLDLATVAILTRTRRRRRRRPGIQPI